MGRSHYAALFGVLLACRRMPPDGGAEVHAATEAGPVAAAMTTSSPTSNSASTATAAPAPASVAAKDAGAGGCVVVRGPIELPVRVPVTLAVRADGVDAVLNDDGRPRIVSRPAGPVPLAPVPAGRESAEGERSAGYSVPCATAGDRVFCSDRAGAVHRWVRGAAEDRIVANARSTSRIAAAIVGMSHVALGYLASRQTSEGWVSEAWLAVDDEAPRRVSDDGCGATALALAPRGAELLVLMTDARTALTALHVRPVTYRDGLRIGEDSVVFVGGPGDRRTRPAFSVPAAGPGWSLLPIARDVGSFGLAIVRVDDPPHVDEPVLWSMYPNGLDPAPVAAATAAGQDGATWVALVRPKSPEPSSPRVLELATLGAAGALEPRDVVATSGNPTDIALAVDPFGAVWIAWVDPGGAWVERLACNSKVARR